MSNYPEKQKAKITYIKIFTQNAETYKERVQKKTFDFIKYDLALFSVIAWLFSESFQKYTGLIIIILFSIGFFWKIILITTQFKEFFPSDDDFWKKADALDHDLVEMDKKFYATQFNVYRNTIKYYKPKMLQINFSILLSFFSILLIIFAKVINEYEKFTYGNQEYTSRIDIIIFILAIIGIIIAVIFFILKIKEIQKENNEEDTENNGNIQEGEVNNES